MKEKYILTKSPTNPPVVFPRKNGKREVTVCGISPKFLLPNNIPTVHLENIAKDKTIVKESIQRGMSYVNEYLLFGFGLWRKTAEDGARISTAPTIIISRIYCFILPYPVPAKDSGDNGIPESCREATQSTADRHKPYRCLATKHWPGAVVLP